MSTIPRYDSDTFFQIAAQFFAERFKGMQFRGLKLLGAAPGGHPFEAPVEPAPTARTSGRNGTRPLIRDKVLAALREAGRPLKGEAVARRAGTPYHAYFRAVLAVMVKDGDLIPADEGGYALPAPPKMTDIPDEQV